MTKLADAIYDAIKRHKNELALSLVTQNRKTLESGIYGGIQVLHLAIEFKNFQFAEKLLELGVDIHCPAVDGSAALYVAAKENNIKGVEWLLAHGADVKHGEGKGRTALLGAVAANNLKLVKRFIDLGADVNASVKEYKDSETLNPLRICYWDKPQHQVAALLREHGAVLPEDCKLDPARFASGGGATSLLQKLKEWLQRWTGQKVVENEASTAQPSDDLDDDMEDDLDDEMDDDLDAAGLGYKAFENDDYEAAIQHFSEAIGRGPLPTLYYYRGVAHEMLGNADEAIEDLSKCLELKPDHSRALYSRSLARRKVEQWEESFADIRRAYEIDPDDFRIVNAYAQFLVRSPVQAHRNSELAVKLATRGCELTDWKDPLCVETLAFAYRELGDASKADEFTAKVKELQSVSPIDASNEVKECFEHHMGKAPNPKGLQEIVPGKVGVSIWIIDPQTDDERKLIFTTGMSELPMSVPSGCDDGPYAELCMRLPADWPAQPSLDDTSKMWPWIWLRRIAHYPHMNNTWIGEYPSVFPVKGPLEPVDSSCNFTAFLLIPNFDPFSGFRSDAGPYINLITVVPIYSEEYSLAKSDKGIPELFHRFQKAHLPAALELNRPNVG
jgi:tetratricopeptide (TPR) repeat protein